MTTPHQQPLQHASSAPSLGMLAQLLEDDVDWVQDLFLRGRLEPTHLADLRQKVRSLQEQISGQG